MKKSMITWKTFSFSHNNSDSSRQFTFSIARSLTHSLIRSFTHSQNESIIPLFHTFSCSVWKWWFECGENEYKTL